MYSLNPTTVKQVLNARLANYENIAVRVTKQVLDSRLAHKMNIGVKPPNVQKPRYDHKQFMHYHLNRYKFNVKADIYTLTAVAKRKYRDNIGHLWTEVHTAQNYFHMPKGNYITTLAQVTKPYSRKFLRNDNVSGIGGEFEMIIRHDGKRVDSLTHEKFQETYNFGRTSNFKEHKLFDVDPHNENANYAKGPSTGSVKIIELKEG